MTLQLEIIDYSSADIPNVWEWVPTSEEDVYFQLQIEVAEVGKQGGNLFQLVVATKSGIKKYQDLYPLANLHVKELVILEYYSWQGVVDYINRELQKCSMNSWTESIQCLSKKFAWEYDGYQNDDK